jgi:hypothetical protein
MPEREGLPAPSGDSNRGRDSIGHPFWNRDYGEAHAKPVIEKAERLKIPMSWL